MTKATLERGGVEPKVIGHIAFGHVINTEPYSGGDYIGNGRCRAGGARDLITMCTSGGQGIALAIEHI